MNETKKQQAENYIEQNFNKKSYENNPYGKLKMYYDYLNEKDISKRSLKQKRLFFIEISDLKNRLIEYAERNYQSPDRRELIEKRLEFIYKTIYSDSFFSTKELSEIEKDLSELNDAFDFELEPIIEKKIIDQNVRQIILGVIESVKTKSPKNPPQPLEFKKIINSKLNWNNAQIEKVEKMLKDKFASTIKEKYKFHNSFELLNGLIFELDKRKVINVDSIKQKKCFISFAYMFIETSYQYKKSNYTNFSIEYNKYKESGIKKIIYNSQLMPKLIEIEDNLEYFKQYHIKVNLEND